MSTLSLKSDFGRAAFAAGLFFAIAHPTTYQYVSSLTGVTGFNLILLHTVVYFVASYLVMKFEGGKA